MNTLFKEPEAAMSTDLVEHRDVTPIQILQSAVERGVDASQLEKLMDLQERWERNQASKQFSEAMHACQEVMPKVVRDAVNNQTKSRYATLEKVQEVCRPIYSAHGFSLSYGEDDCPVPGYKRTVCDVRHSGGHCVRYHLDLPIDGIGAKGNAIGAMNPVQACISTTSYGQRRLTSMIFNLTLAGEDDDGQSFATISEKEVATIEDWCAQLEVKTSVYTKWIGVGHLHEMTPEQYENVMAEIMRKAKQKGIA